jgi:DNA repair protein RadC
MEINVPVKEKIISAKKVYEIMSKVLEAEDDLDKEKEHLWAIGLNSQNRIIYIDLVHLGAINHCLAAPMEIYRRACIKGNSSLIVVHNHPSGTTEPSSNDRLITKKLKESGEILGIKLLDHIIIASEGFFSFSDSEDL